MNAECKYSVILLNEKWSTCILGDTTVSWRYKKKVAWLFWENLAAKDTDPTSQRK